MGNGDGGGRSRAVRLLVVAAAAVLAALPAVAGATPVRATHGATTTNVYLQNVATGRFRLLTYNDVGQEDALAYSPALSAGGTRLAFAETPCHYCASTIRVSTVGAERWLGRAVAPGFQPTWAPDGRLVFVRPEGAIAITSKSLSRPRVLVRGGLANATPRWQPRGWQLAFARQLSASSWQVFTVRSDGTGLRQVTRGPGSAVDPAWSPDGRRLAFARQQRNGRWQVCIGSATGTSVRCIRSGSSDTQPAWSSDGRRLAFVRQTALASRIWIMRPDGRDQRRVELPPGVVSALQPTWSPRNELLFVGRIG
jgi:Tol biopolymer transport system component